VRYAPAASRSKVVILDEAHMLTGEASNALLKTLEEPPDRVIFVMATTQPEDLADTIRSRSQHFHFRALTFVEISGRLEHIAKEENLEIAPGALAVIARMAEGSLRDALSLLEQARAYCGDNIPDKEVRELLGVVPEDALDELVNAIAEGSADRALGLVHRFQKDGRNLQHFCREAIRHIRNLLIARVSGADSELIAATPDQRPALARAAALFSEEDLTRFFQILLQTDDSLRRAPDPRVHLEMGLLRLINASRLAPLEELMTEMKGGVPGSGTGTSGASRGVAASISGAQKKALAETAAQAPVMNEAAWRPALDSGAAEKENDVKQFTELARTPAIPGASAPGSGDAAGPPEEDGAREISAIAETSGAGFLAEESVKTETATPVVLGAEGISEHQVTAIKTAIQAEKKFLGELVEQSNRWQLEGNELRIFFPADKRAFAELLEGRDALEKIRGAANKVLGKPVRVCAKIESIAAAAAAGAPGISQSNASSPGVRQNGSGVSELRARFETDPMVRSMMERFGGRISEVKPRPSGS
jgi:DNA polymerase-3 subunit gamma/tau